MRARIRHGSETGAILRGSAGHLSFVSFAQDTKAEGLDDMSAGSECKEGVKKIKDLYRVNGMFLGKCPELRARPTRCPEARQCPRKADNGSFASHRTHRKKSEANMAFVMDKSELKPGLVLFRRGDVEHRMPIFSMRQNCAKARRACRAQLIASGTRMQRSACRKARTCILLPSRWERRST